MVQVFKTSAIRTITQFIQLELTDKRNIIPKEDKDEQECDNYSVLNLDYKLFKYIRLDKILPDLIR